MPDNHRVTVTVNGEPIQAIVPARLSLADWLREELLLTGTHLGCEQGACGACTVLLDGMTIRSCLAFVVQIDGRSVTTVEYLASQGNLNELQAAFSEHHALQCGFCTPGFLMTAAEYIGEGGSADHLSIRERLAGNLCRCTGYQGIVEAIAAVATRQHET